LCGCENWSFTLREEDSLRVFVNGELGRIFAPKKVEATGEWRKFTMGSFVICTHPKYH
jgi:hypothetical protein